MVQIVTSERFALCGVQGSPAAAAMRATLQRARDAAHVHDIRLHDIDRAHLDHARPGGQVPVLLAARDVERERIGHLLGFLEFPVRAGLLVVAHALGLEQRPTSMARRGE